jgi:peptidoglycan/LPS O-acetylase OafA/YrhL
MNRKLSFIEALRGFAILGVILTHSTQVTSGLPTWLNNAGMQGARGVQLFFIVSAFTLFYSLYQKYEIESIEVKEFFIRRFFRIAPTFYTALICYSFVDIIYNKLGIGVGDHGNNYTFGLVFSTLTFTSLLNPEWLFSLVPGGWSISAEMLFYLLVPIFFLYIKNIKGAIFLVITTLSLSFLCKHLMINLEIIGDNSLREKYLFYWFPNQLPIFALGIFLFFILKNKLVVPSSSNIPRKTIMVSNLLIFGSIAIIALLGVLGGGGKLFPIHFIFGISFVVLAYGLAVNEKHFLVNRLTVFIGKISFSMYLIHFIVLDVVNKVITDSVGKVLPSELTLSLVFVGTLIITVVLSNISYKFVEVPGIKLGRKFSTIAEKSNKLKISA